MLKPVVCVVCPSSLIPLRDNLISTKGYLFNRVTCGNPFFTHRRSLYLEEYKELLNSAFGLTRAGGVPGLSTATSLKLHNQLLCNYYENKYLGRLLDNNQIETEEYELLLTDGDVQMYYNFKPVVTI